MEEAIDYTVLAHPKKYRELTKPKQLQYRQPAKKTMNMTGLSIPKLVRVNNPEAKNEVKKAYCELCGKPAYHAPHHIESVGSGGPDIKENQIQLCNKCHIKAHSGKVPKGLLFLIVAKREKTDAANLIDRVKSQCV